MLITFSSVTVTSCSPILTLEMPQAGREWVSRMREKTSMDADILRRREPSVLPSQKAALVLWANRRNGDIRSD